MNRAVERPQVHDPGGGIDQFVGASRGARCYLLRGSSRVALMDCGLCPPPPTTCKPAWARWARQRAMSICRY